MKEKITMFGPTKIYKSSIAEDKSDNKRLPVAKNKIKPKKKLKVK